MARRMASRVRLLLVAAALPLLLWAVLPMISSGATQGDIQRKIEQKRSQIAKQRGREHVLSSDIAVYSKRIGALQGDITQLQSKQVRLEADLSAKRAELERIQADLRRERLRLARLKARLAEARVALAGRLVALYKADKPDIVTVVLNSNGFEDLLERTSFMERVSSQDARIMNNVKNARVDAIATAKHLGQLEAKARQIAQAIEGQRNEVVRVKGTLVDRQQRWASARSEKNTVLASTRSSRQHLEDDVAALQAQSAKIASALQAAAARSAGAGGGGTAGPIRQGSGGLIWPVNGPITSPFCESRAWESCHPGIDIGVPSGTPIRAAASGRVVLMQPESASGGYGNFTCVQHTASMSTCYAHQSSFGTSMGANVHQGQVIGYTGCTGRCFGPHLHFEVRINGSVVNPLNYL
jgi:murein DD-endopeptidase MepM/ murein hydrolase activator NlpD